MMNSYLNNHIPLQKLLDSVKRFPIIYTFSKKIVPTFLRWEHLLIEWKRPYYSFYELVSIDYVTLNLLLTSMGFFSCGTKSLVW